MHTHDEVGVKPDAHRGGVPIVKDTIHVRGDDDIFDRLFVCPSCLLSTEQSRGG